MGQPVCDPNFASVGLQLLMNGSNGSTTFVDSSNNALAVTNTNSMVESNTQPPPFQATAGSILPRGTQRYIQVPITASGPVDISSGDFTVEGWLWGATQDGSGGGGAGEFLSDGTSPAAAGPNVLTYNPSSKVVQGGGIFAGGSAVSASVILSQWNSFAFVRRSGTLTVYLNGVGGTPVVSSGSVSGNWNIGAALISQPFSGYLAGIMITKGLARYTANYTPGPPLGSCVVNVPNVVGQTTAAGTATLVAAGYQTTVVQQNSNVIPGDIIISHVPTGGGLFPLGGNITLTVSAGPALVAGMGGDTWGANGGDVTADDTRPPILTTLSYAQQPANAQYQGNASVMSAESNTALPLTMQTPAYLVPTTPKVGS
jgi:hypothetical protein